MLLSAAGGIALFLWGIRGLSESLEDSLADRAKELIGRAAGSPCKGFITGTLATVLLQSSSLTTVMVVSIVNARIITLKQAVGVIIGANVGTTVTAHMLSFEFHRMALPLFAAGFILSMVPVTTATRWGRLLCNFAVVLLGFNFMVEALAPLSESQLFTGFIKDTGTNLWQGIGTGFVATGIMQSSSGVMGVTIAMATGGSISLSAALAILIGADVGTCITALIASLRAGITARRAAFCHLMVNLFNLLLVVPWFSLFVHIVESTAPQLPRQLANGQTLYNLWGALFLMPLVFLWFYISDQNNR